MRKCLDNFRLLCEKYKKIRSFFASSLALTVMSGFQNNFQNYCSNFQENFLSHTYLQVRTIKLREEFSELGSNFIEASTKFIFNLLNK